LSKFSLTGKDLNLTKCVSDKNTALQDISFQIKAGQNIGICGRTGSGKSTLVSVLLRLVDPTEGTVSIDGRSLTTVHRNTVRERIICLPQESLIFPRTFKFNLAPQDDLIDESILISVLHRVGLWDLVESRGGLLGIIDPSTLSHGEKQLLALSRALLRRRMLDGRCILVLDEATSSLDERTQTMFHDVVEKDFHENTVIIVAHRLETVRDTDLVVVLEQGRIIRMGAPSEVL
jgi:ATP-binding cassette subfamily C (CFTR/MRP) protein 1